jgi:hypothetical protein
MSIDADLNKATLLPNADPLFQVQKNRNLLANIGDVYGI